MDFDMFDIADRNAQRCATVAFRRIEGGAGINFGRKGWILVGKWGVFSRIILTTPFSNTPATRAALATTNLEKRLEPRAGKRLGQFRDCTVGPGLPNPPVNAVGASAGRRAAAPALAEARPSRLGGRRSDESEGKGSTIAWFTSLSGETVQAMVEPLVWGPALPRRCRKEAGGRYTATCVM